MGSSKKQTVGYQYFLGMHQILTHGPVDFMSKYTVDERLAWQGQSTGGSIFVNAPNLFGGEGREGGVQGTMDLEMGAQDQMPNDYLQSKLGNGGNIPAFRTVVGIVMRQMYLGNNPYLKKNAFRLQRIHVRQDGVEQWYDEKAEIKAADSVLISTTSSGWEYVQLPEHANPGYENLTPPASGWVAGTSPFGSGGWTWPGQPARNTNWSMGTVLWARKQVTVPVGKVVVARVRAENGCVLFLNGAYLGAANRDNVQLVSGEIFDFTLPPGTHTLMFKAFDEIPTEGDTYISVEVTTVSIADMNPAHMIRECLTDPIWGMGYNEDDIDDDSFMAAADALYDERMGMSLLWDRQMPIEQFVQEVIKHINAALYVGRRGPAAGKFVLRLIRGDYDIETLPVFDESNIEKIEGFKRVEEGELTNSVTVNYWDSATGKTASTTAQDPALIQQQGAVINTTMQYPGFTVRELADRAALRDLGTLSTPMASCTIYTGLDAKELNIGDPIAVSWSDYGLVKLVMRITGMALGDGKSNKIKLTVAQDAFALPEQGVIVPPDVGWEDPNQEPIPLTRQVAEEMPYYELVQQFSQSVVDTQLTTMPDMGMVGASASRPQSGAINARFLTDSGAGYEDVGAIDFCASALLDGDVGLMDNVIELTSGIDLSSVEPGMYAGIGSEYVGVVSLAGTTLTVKRGVLDTVPQEHASGALIIFADPFLQVDPTEYVASDEIGVKLLTVTGQGTIQDAAPIELTMNSRAVRPYPPGNFQVNGQYFPSGVPAGDVTVSFATRNRILQTGGELVGFTDGDVTPEAGTTYRVDVRDPVTDVLLDSVAGASSPIVVPQASFTTNEARLNLFSVRDGYDSWQPQSVVVETGVALWTPAFLGKPAKVWFNDESPITEVSGFISQVNDLSASGYNATQGTAANRPARVPAVLNNRAVFRFDGSNDRLLGPSSGGAIQMLSGVSEAWAIIVYKSSTTNSSNRYTFGIAHTSGNLARFLLCASDTNNGSHVNNPGLGGRSVPGSDSYSQINHTDSVGTNWTFTLNRIKYTTKTGIINLNGGADYSATMANMTAGVSQAINHNPFAFGKDSEASTNSHFGGDIAEVIFGTGTLSQADIDRLNGYVAWRWGLVSLLPSGHPYKAAAPTLSGYGTLYGEQYGE